MIEAALGYCFITRSHFSDVFCPDNFTEELLAIHEHQVERMKNYYEKHKHMFKMVEKRDSMFNRMKEFEVNNLYCFYSERFTDCISV